MNLFVYHTSPHVPERRTHRVGSDDPGPIQIDRGFDAILNFSFRDNQQRPYPVSDGMNPQARIYNHEDVEIWVGTLVPNPLVSWAAQLTMSKAETETFEAGLYTMKIDYMDENGRKLVAQSRNRSQSKFMLKLV